MKIRAGIYCRVSTEDLVQKTSLESQEVEAKEVLAENGWDLYRCYIDDGKTGTSTHKRDAYMQMLEDVQDRNLDVVVVKSIDRLMRSAIDWYLFVDMLNKTNTKIYFYLEKKFYSSDDALLTGIRAILAEEFSRDLSKKVNQAHKSRQGKGKALLSSSTWGYDISPDGIILNAVEAEMVREAYHLCFTGFSLDEISKELEKKGFRSRGGKRLAIGTLSGIIRNSLYKGTAVMNKVHYDFELKKFVPVEKENWVVVENAVPAIVSRDVWDGANAKLDSRCMKIGDRFVGKKRGKSPLSGKIFCGVCGSLYWFRNTKAKGEHWVCKEYVQHGKKGCDNATVPHALLMDFLDGQVRLLKGNPSLVMPVQSNIQEKIKALQELYCDGTLEESLYKKKLAELEQKPMEIRSGDLGLEFIQEHIKRIEVFSDYVEISYDIPLPLDKIVNLSNIGWRDLGGL